MKYVISLLIGLVVGAALFALGLLYNPFIAAGGLSPLTVTDADTILLNYSTVPSETIVLTNNGESLHAPNPEKVLQLWETPIRRTNAMVSELRGPRGDVTGIGVKISSESESTRLFNGEAIKDSVWYVYLPGEGSLFIQQTENYWPFVREVGFSAWRSSAKNWRGTWFGNLTAGPGALRTAKVTGSSGRFSGLETEALESLTVRAFSADTGFVSAEGRLVIELPTEEAVSDQPD